MPYRPSGSTGQKVSIVGLGGSHIGKQADEKESIAIIRSAIDRGINFMDTCWDYNKGASEERMAQMPLNVMDAHYKCFERKVLPVAVSSKIGVLYRRPALCDEPADVNSDHRVRQNGDPGPGDRRGAHLPADEKRRSRQC
jgi:hypothetical protein